MSDDKKPSVEAFNAFMAKAIPEGLERCAEEEARIARHLDPTTTDAPVPERYRRIAAELNRPPEEFPGQDALRQLDDWCTYLGAGWCPHCQDKTEGFKMCSPPICTRCGWQARRSLDDALRAVEQALRDAHRGGT